jgi:D-alanyl-D-alanine carboxypeptidase
MFSWTTHAHAQNAPALLSKGVAVYGWKDGTATELYSKNQHTLYPLASITKLITAKAAEMLYPENQLFTIPNYDPTVLKERYDFDPGTMLTRNDMLTALLVKSSNAAAVSFANRIGKKNFLAVMNTILHDGGYTDTSFINSSGLDPTTSNVKPNRMTPYHLTILLNDIYNHDSLLTSIMSQTHPQVHDLSTDAIATLIHTTSLYDNPNYASKIIISKTGTTTLAGQNLVFVTPGAQGYDYFTVVLLGSTNRNRDAMRVIDWLDSTPQLALAAAQ